MTVSVIVPVYNIENEIEKCILSIIKQTYQQLEIILVDDGSTDNSLSICQRYAGEDDRIQVIHKENGGLVSARKAGIQAAHGEYVTHIDGDDWVEPEYIQSLVDASEDGMVDVVITGFIEDAMDYSEKRCSAIAAGLYDKEKMKKLVYPIMINANPNGNSEIYPSQCCKLIRRRIAVEKQMQVDDRLSLEEDAACIYPVLLQAKTMKVINGYHYHYVRRQNSLSMGQVDAKEYFNSVKDVYNHLKKEFLKDEGRAYLMLQLEDYTSVEIMKGIGRCFPLRVYNYLFPYEMIEKNSKVVLYGGGIVGRSFYKQLLKNQYCKVVLWVDRDYQKIDLPYAKIMSPEAVLSEEYDYVVICIQNLQLAQGIKQKLRLMGIPEEKIIWKGGYQGELETIVEMLEG